MIIPILVALQASTPQTPPPTGSARARANLASYVSDNDYPLDALRDNAQGTVGFRLIVGADGTVTECKIEQSSGNSSLDGQTCAIMMARARFTPARDSQGHAVPDIVRSRITWRIANSSEFAPFETLQLVWSLSAAGTRCTIALNGPEQELPECPEPPPSVAELLRAVNGDATITAVISQVPSGRPRPARNPLHGRLLAESEASFTIGADGVIESCALTSRTVHAEGAPSPPPDPCDGMRPRFAPSTSSTPRTGTINLAYYLAIATDQ